MLLSGVAALTLSRSEIDTLSDHYKLTLESLLKLHKKTPEPFIFFISGSLPFPGILHLRQLGLFSTICRLKDNILHSVAKYVLTTASDNSKSWFVQLKNICSQYGLPHPLQLLECPPTKDRFKHLTNLKVQEFWVDKLRKDVQKLSSLKLFNPFYMSLSSPHPIISTC